MSFNSDHQMSLPGVGSQMNKSEQVSNDDHQTSLGGGWGLGGFPGLMSVEGVSGLMSGGSGRAGDDVQ